MLTLAGLAATVSLIALDQQPAAAHPVQGDADSWSVDDVDGIATWTGHTHTGWKQKKSERPIDPWTGAPTGNPCDDDPNKVHCAYVIKHSNPWLIWKSGPPKHPQHSETWFSDCAVLGGGEGRLDQRAAGTAFSVGNMRFFRGGAATCTDGTDAPGRGVFAPDAPGGGHLHGDQDFLDQHPEVNDYPADWPVVALRGQRLPAHQQVIADAHANGRTSDEIRSQGKHLNSGNTVTGDEHKTVMFWVWWERAADTTETCDDGTQPPCPEPEEEATTFAPEVTLNVGEDS